MVMHWFCNPENSVRFRNREPHNALMRVFYCTKKAQVINSLNDAYADTNLLSEKDPTSCELPVKRLY